MTSTPLTAAIADLTRPGGGLDLGHDPARLLVHILRLLAHGHPVTRDHALDTVAEVGIDPAHANALLDAWTETNDTGDIVGLGLTYNPTSHQMTIDGMRMWAWCAMDTLIFTHVLNKPVTIESTAPGSGQIVRLTASPAGITTVSPADTVVTLRAPGRDQIDTSTKTAIWGTFCHHSFFFPHRTHAEQWAAARDDIAILSLDEGLAVARDLADALLRYEPAGSR